MERPASQNGASPVRQESTLVKRPSRLSPLQTGISRGMAIHVQMTPPDTPICPYGGHDDPSAGQNLFHNYLRAFYTYDPSTSAATGDDSLLSAVAIKPGDLILIHSVHANGWADGTVLSSGARGWLPTNYCEAYDHPYMRNLLNAMTQFWDLLRANENANLSTFVRQDYIRGLIAGVRYLLEHADCLHRDAVLVQRYVGIRRMRKGLLADLSSLVQIAKNLQETISEPFAAEVVHYLIEDLMAKAFKVVTRATSFVDIWLKENTEYKAEVKQHETARSPITPPLDLDHRIIGTQKSKRVGIANPSDSAKSAPRCVSGVGSSQVEAGAERTISPPPKATSPLSSILHVRAGSVAHRLSLVEADRSPPSGLASDQLAKVHDACISHIGAFIGHHLHSRPSGELMQTTERLVRACKNMLAIAAEVHARDSFRSTSVQKARDEFESKLDELFKATKDVFKFSDLEDCDVVIMPQQSSRLVSVGTGLIRVAGVCVVRTRALIEQVGDFELEQPPAPVSSPPTSPEVGSTPLTQKRDSRAMTSFEKRLSKKMLPPPPPIRSSIIASGSFDFGLESPSLGSDASTPITPKSTVSRASLHAVPSMQRRSLARLSGTNFNCPSQRSSSRPASRVEVSPARMGSAGMSIAGSTDTVHSSARDSATSHVSEGSTRATTPDHAKDTNSLDPRVLNSFTSASSMRSSNAGEPNEVDTAQDAETQLLLKTYASELTLNQSGQVTGGSLPALVEQLTPNDAAPEPQFATAFYVTFRMFTSPRELAQALFERFDYVGENKAVRFRIYNVFKGWLETYWNFEADKDALGDVRFFAVHKLKPFSQSAGDRLVDLIRKVTAGYADGKTCGPLVSGVGKTTMSIGHQQENAKTAPEPVISKSQLNVLKSAAKDGGASCSILDFDPLELARQCTLMTSKVFCSIQPDELLSLQWNNPETQVSLNVRGMIKLNTALANVVGATILAPEDAKKRALVIKHWAKIAQRCLDLNNYDSLMSIMASLNSSVIKRLKRTWEAVSKKTKLRFDELNKITDSARNHGALRSRLEDPVAPCIPFLGITLTDLTMLAEYYPKTKELPGTATDNGEPVTIINFDKHAKMAKVVCHLQKFQVPYKLQDIPEMQTWIETSMRKMTELGSGDNQTQFFRRSLIIEPKADSKQSNESKRSNDSNEDRPKTAGGKERWEMFMKSNSFSFKTTHPDLPATGNFHDEKRAMQDRKTSVITIASTATGDTKHSQAPEQVTSSHMEWN